MLSEIARSANVSPAVAPGPVEIAVPMCDLDGKLWNVPWQEVGQRALLGWRTQSFYTTAPPADHGIMAPTAPEGGTSSSVQLPAGSNLSEHFQRTGVTGPGVRLSKQLGDKARTPERKLYLRHRGKADRDHRREYP